MNSWISLFTGSDAFALGMVLLVKSTLLLGLAGAIAAFRRSAAERHLVWTLAVSGLLVLAVLAPFAPKLGVPVGQAPVVHLPKAAKHEFAKTDFNHAAKSVAGTGAARATVDAGSSRSLVGLNSSTLPLVWGAGLAALLLWCALGHVGLARIARSATPLDREDWRALLAGTLARSGVARRVLLGRSGAVGAPVTWGWSRPVILLPDEADTWPDGRRRVAVAHEVAHVARHDYIIQLIATLTLAVYWFHPLAWYAVRRLRIESEHACDDRVLADGTAASDYASHLIEVARRARSLRLGGMVAISMARSTHLGRRILAVLDETRERRPVSTRAFAVIAALLALTLVPYAGLQPVLTASAKDVTNIREDDNREGASANHSIPAKPGEDLILELDTGGSVEVRGWDQPNVHVRSRLGGADWEDTRVEVDRVSGGVRVRSVHEGDDDSYSTSHAFEFKVPRRFNIRINSAGGGLDVYDVEGTFRGGTGGGNFVLEKVRGSASLTTGGGDIDVSDSDLSGMISTGGGTVRLSRVRGGLRGHSGSGPVIYAEGSAASGTDKTTGDLEGVTIDKSHIRVDDEYQDRRGLLHIQKAGGAVDLNEAPEGASISTGGGDIRVGRASGLVDASTGGGDVRIGPVAGSVEANTGAGDVHVILSKASGDDQSVDLWSGKGRIIVELPPDFAGRFELETAYTKKNPATRITSAWPLRTESTTDWDDEEGSPRRYVRAHGTVGNGEGVVRIKTVNGNIEVRKAAR
jgi:beta-lactamase regulating signal transducer with metallopeptidase domain/DUF4097 and DUF4098 domain-containing protein YvlB